MEHQLQQTLHDQRQEQNDQAADRGLPDQTFLGVGDPSAHSTEDEDSANQIGDDGRNRSEDIAQDIHDPDSKNQRRNKNLRNQLQYLHGNVFLPISYRSVRCG